MPMMRVPPVPSGKLGRPTGPDADGGPVFQAQKASGHILDIVFAKVVVPGRKHALWRAAVGQRRDHVFALVSQLGIGRARSGHHFGIAHDPQQGVERVDANVVEGGRRPRLPLYENGPQVGTPRRRKAEVSA